MSQPLVPVAACARKQLLVHVQGLMDRHWVEGYSWGQTQTAYPTPASLCTMLFSRSLKGSPRVCVCVYTAPSDQIKTQVALFSPMEYLCPVGVDQDRALLIGRWKLSNKYRKQQLSWKLPQHLQDTVGSDLTRVLTDGGKGGSKMGAVKDQRPQFRHQRGEKEWGRREEAQ